MNGAHDLGGKHGFGAVRAEAHEPVFHAKWEARFFGLVNALGSHCTWTLDEDRHACENQTPQSYLTQSYYENWLQAFEKLLVRHSVINTTGAQHHGLAAAKVKETLSERLGYDRSIAVAAKFEVGNQILTRNLQPAGHTRLPSYLRGHSGTIVAVRGAHVFPDRNAHGQGEDPRWLYSVRFQSSEIWGRPSNDVIHADLWEPYLERA
jgi:nitrile hydratase subunit beta